jgi:S-adenosylmethionine:tRNA ribosyltransferase-isomerase
LRRRELEFFELPPERIAQRPVEPRDASRLLVLHRATGDIEHRTFREIVEYLRPGDCLLRNDTRVIPARFFCRRRTGGRVEALFLHEQAGRWRVLLKSSGRLREGERLHVQETATSLALREPLGSGQWSVEPDPPIEPLELLDRVGQTPLPPYIRRGPAPDAADRERYQTVFARTPGAAAAPTAGMHFTPGLLEAVAARGVRVVDVTLHIGPGTFAPVTANDLSEHVMHAEWFNVSDSAAAMLRDVRSAGRRIVAVGTTAARVLESLDPGDLRAISRWTRLFIYPPYRFRNVDVLLTNFHLPGSTLLALVMAFAGAELTRHAYFEAISRDYRFYSYGDAMLIV